MEDYTEVQPSDNLSLAAEQRTLSPPSKQAFWKLTILSGFKLMKYCIRYRWASILENS